MIEKEQEAAKAYKDVKDESTSSVNKVAEARNKLLESQKKVAMLEVMAVNARKMKELEEKRKAATAAAEAAKRNLLEQRQREKDALEATRKALEEARQKAKEAKGIGRGAAKRATGEADTVPATLPDGEDIE